MKGIKEEAVKTVTCQAINDESDTKEIVIRTGDAYCSKEPVKVEIEGTILSVPKYLTNRVSRIDQQSCHIIVNRERMEVSLFCDEENPYGAKVVGRLSLSPEFLKFGINSKNELSHSEMAELFKMNRSHFESKATAMSLVSILQNFKAKVERDIEQSENNRGDRRALVSQAVEHNLPEAFKLNIPIFRGMPKESVTVEVYVSPSDFSCMLVSPEANDIIELTKNNVIDGVIEDVRTLCPDIVIIEQ